MLAAVLQAGERGEGEESERAHRSRGQHSPWGCCFPRAVDKQTQNPTRARQKLLLLLTHKYSHPAHARESQPGCAKACASFASKFSSWLHQPTATPGKSTTKPEESLCLSSATGPGPRRWGTVALQGEELGWPGGSGDAPGLAAGRNVAAGTARWGTAQGCPDVSAQPSWRRTPPVPIAATAQSTADLQGLRGKGDVWQRHPGR